MRAVVRRILETAERVRGFMRTHPSDDPSYATLLARLDDRLTRADKLALEERGGRIAERWAAARRVELRRTMHRETLRHLVRIGEAAAKEKPELAGKFQLRSKDATHKSFLIGTRQMLAEGLANKELFVSLGLSEAMLEELTKEVSQFEDSTEIGNAGRLGHVGARANLDAVAAELLGLIELFDTLNRRRFRDDPALAATWESARLILGPHRSRPEVPPPSVPPTEGGVTPPPGDVAPAA